MKFSHHLEATRSVGTNPSSNLGACRKGPVVQFCVWAPFAEKVEVHLIEQDIYLPMERTADGYHKASSELAPESCRYLYRINGSKEHPDPASRWQPEGVHHPSAILPTEFEWGASDWKGIELSKYIFYELHVGTFTAQGTFDAMIDRLPELKELGITAIEIMPVAEFPGERNWGYDGVYPFAVHHVYGGPQGLKRLVKASHSMGIAVVLDVVYNHLGPEGNYLAEFGPYFTDHYNTPWGAALNFDEAQSDEVVRYFVENALQWLDEFRIDALRLDAIHGIVDRSAQPFLSLLSRAVDELASNQGRHIHLIAESDLNDFRVIQQREQGGYGIHAQWTDDFHHALHSLQTGQQDGYYGDFGSMADLAKAYRCGFIYEGQYSKNRKQRHGNSSASLPGEANVVCSQNHDQIGNRMLGERSSLLMDFERLKLSAAIVLLSPFLPLLFMGEEFGETSPFQYFTSHTDEDLAGKIRECRQREFAAFGWKEDPPDAQNESTFQGCKVHSLNELTPDQHVLRDFYITLIQMRKSVPALRELNKDLVAAEASESSRLLVVKRGSGQEAIYILFNLGHDPVPFPHAIKEGRWQCLLDSSSAKWLGPGRSIVVTVDTETVGSMLLAPHSVSVFCRDSE